MKFKEINPSPRTLMFR